MKNKYSFYYQKNNKIFDSNILTICYSIDSDEMERYSLTSNNILLLIKSNKIDELMSNNKIDFFDVISNAFDGDIFFRIQSECLLGVYGDSHCDCEIQKKEFLDLLKTRDGIFVHLPQEAQGWGLFYKCKELELQVNGRDQNGKTLGKFNRDEAQKYLLHNEGFFDKRSYEIVFKILENLKLNNKKYIVYTESNNKINEMNNYGIKAIRYSDFIKKEISRDNVAEYLIKILNSTHSYSNDIIDNICSIIESRKYNNRTLNTLIDIVYKINNDTNYKIEDYTKKRILKAYDEIICGEERNYILKYSSTIKIQNKFTCEVNPLIFKQLINIYKKNIFGRLCFEKMYYFSNKNNKNIKKIRTSKVLAISEINSNFFVEQLYSVERDIFSENKNVIEDTTSLTKLRTMFENTEFDYIKKQEMITFISEDELNGMNLYLKRIPGRQNYVLDIYGQKKNIKALVNKLTKQKQLALLNVVNNIDLEDDNYSNYNLRFCDLNLAIQEELDNFKKLKG